MSVQQENIPVVSTTTCIGSLLRWNDMYMAKQKKSLSTTLQGQGVRDGGVTSKIALQLRCAKIASYAKEQ